MEAVTRRAWLAACAALPFFKTPKPVDTDMAYFRSKLLRPLRFPRFPVLAFDYTAMAVRRIDIDGVPTDCAQHRCILQVPGWSLMRCLLAKQAHFVVGGLQVESYVAANEEHHASGIVDVIRYDDGGLMTRFELLTDYTVLQLAGDGSTMCYLFEKDGMLCGTKAANFTV
jgi:hypothetical protein